MRGLNACQKSDGHDGSTCDESQTMTNGYKAVILDVTMALEAARTTQPIRRTGNLPSFSL